MRKIEEAFEVFAAKVSDIMGSGITFVFVGIVTGAALWFVDGVVVNIGISVATMMMVFLLQNTQNKSDEAMHLKLDDILIRLDETDDELAGVERTPSADMLDKKAKIRKVIQERYDE